MNLDGYLDVDLFLAHATSSHIGNAACFSIAFRAAPAQRIGLSTLFATETNPKSRSFTTQT